MNYTMIKDIIHAQTDSLITTSEHEIESVIDTSKDKIHAYILLFDYFINKVDALAFSDFTKSKATENLYDIIKALNRLNYFDFYENVEPEILDFAKKQSLLLDKSYEPFQQADFVIDQYIKELGVILLDNGINPNFDTLSDAINNVQLLSLYANQINADFIITIPLLSLVANQLSFA